MLISELFELVNYISNKHQSGEALRINRFNQLVDVLNKDFFKRKVEELEVYRRRGNPPPQQAYYNSKLLREFVRIEVVAVGADKEIDLTVGADLDYDFAYLIGMIGVVGGRQRNIELVTDEEYGDRWEDSIVNDDTIPYATIADNRVHISWHANINPVEFTYYRFPVTPVCDYYLDVNGVMQFLTAAQVHVWATGEIQSNGVVRTIGDPNYTSLTVELEYNEDLHMEFLWNVLSVCGIKIEQPQIAQYSEMMKAEEKQQ